MDQQVEALIDELLDDPANVVDPGAVLARIDHPSCRWASVNSALRDPRGCHPGCPSSSR
ncbi:hypothetical protein [Nocardioides sp.]|uniref:hypothetical protein n=1 Tax=Nocardioides sp. TaxID=35761 RepID=UPI0035274D54